MLREIRGVKQDRPELTRRWFQSSYFDLFTWQDSSGAFSGFQLCYDIEHKERAFIWNARHGFFHDGVDNVEAPESQAAAILLREGRLDSGTVMPRFTREAAQIAAEVRDLVLAKIREHLIEQHQRRKGRKRVRREHWQERPGASGA